MIPAAFVLPLWLFVGWIAFQAGAWALLWVLLLAIPSVFVGQLILTLLVRARPTARAERAVSWWDVAGLSAWHLLTISLGFFNQAWWLPVFLLTVVVGLTLFWMMLWQLWREARPGVVSLRTTSGMSYFPPSGQTPPRQSDRQQDPEVIVISEHPRT